MLAPFALLILSGLGVGVRVFVFQFQRARQHHRVERSLQMPPCAGVYRGDARVYDLRVGRIGAPDLIAFQRDEVRNHGDAEEYVATAFDRGLDGAVDALALQRVQVHGRRGHQKRRDHDAQEHAGHETPVRHQAPDNEPGSGEARDVVSSGQRVGGSCGGRMASAAAR